MVTERQIREDGNVSAIFLIYSIFSDRNHISFFSHKGYDKLITINGKKGGVLILVGDSHFSAARAQYQGKSAMFSRARGRAK